MNEEENIYWLFQAQTLIDAMKQGRPVPLDKDGKIVIDMKSANSSKAVPANCSTSDLSKFGDPFPNK
jgi:hypothetical protein